VATRIVCTILQLFPFDAFPLPFFHQASNKRKHRNLAHSDHLPHDHHSILSYTPGRARRQADRYALRRRRPAGRGSIILDLYLLGLLLGHDGAVEPVEGRIPIEQHVRVVKLDEPPPIQHGHLVKVEDGVEFVGNGDDGVRGEFLAD
jgi:hypothetical protein